MSCRHHLLQLLLEFLDLLQIGCGSALLLLGRQIAVHDVLDLVHKQEDIATIQINYHCKQESFFFFLMQGQCSVVRLALTPTAHEASVRWTE